MGTGITQPSFTSGELAPTIYGRIDFARYYTGLKTCRNFIVRQFGGVSNRPGTRFVAEVKDSTKRARLIPFEFSSSQAYVLEFGDHVIRIIKDGGVIVWPEGENEGEPVEVETPWGEYDLPLLKFTQSADIMTICHPSHKTRQLSRSSHTDWSLTEFANTEGPFSDTNIDTSKTILASAATGTITLTANFDAFTDGHVGRMIYLEQSPDDTTKKWEVQKSISINDIRRRGANYYVAETAGTTGTVAPSSVEGSERDGDPGVKWGYLHSGFGVARITEYTDTRHVKAVVIKRIPDLATASGNQKVITDVVTGAEAVPDVSAVVYAKVRANGHGFSDGSQVVIADVTGAEEANGTWTVDVIDVNWFYLVGIVLTSAYTSGGSAAKSTGAVPCYKWAFEAWGGEMLYPGTTIYSQERQCFAGVYGNPQTAWMSRTSGFKDFGTSSPILDTDAITFTLNSRKANDIRHFVELQDLILLTADGPFLIRGAGTDGVLAPGKIITKRQGSSGASHLPPLIIGNIALYVQEKGSQVLSLGYNLTKDSFDGNDLTVISSHLFRKRKITEWAFQTVPFSCAWAIRDDGVLLGFTFMPEHEVAGWHRHDTDGKFESVCSISEGSEDAVYFVVRRTIEGVEKRYIERISSREVESDHDYYFVDCGLTYDGRNTDLAKNIRVSGGTTWDFSEELALESDFDLLREEDIGSEIQILDENDQICRFKILEVAGTREATVSVNRLIPEMHRETWLPEWSLGRSHFSGLDHLEGKTVSILADGNVSPAQVVTDGAIGIGFCAAVVHAGLPYLSDFETLELSSMQRGIREKNQIINHVSFILEESRGLWVGPDANNLTEEKPRSDEGYSQSPRAVSGLVDIRITASWNKGGRVFVRQSDPLPLTILAVIPEVTTGGS